MAKDRFGISLEHDVTEQVEALTERCDEMDATRSEIIEAILTAFFGGDLEHEEMVREHIQGRRQGYQLSTEETEFSQSVKDNSPDRD